MKRVGFVVVALLLGTPLVCRAQTEQPTGAKPTNAVIAVVDTTRFADEKGGIRRYVSALKHLSQINCFSEIPEIERRIETLQGATKRLETAATLNCEAIVATKSELEGLRNELKKKKEEAAAAYENVKKKVLEPIERDISAALEQFAKNRGATLVFDIARPPTGALLYIDQSADLTNAFIAEYNRNHP